MTTVRTPSNIGALGMWRNGPRLKRPDPSGVVYFYTVLVFALAGSSVLVRFGSWIWYLLSLAGVLIVGFCNRPTYRRDMYSYQLVAALVILGAFGSLVGRVFEDQSANALAFFFPMLIVFVDSLRGGSFSSANVISAVRIASSVYCAVAILVVGFDLGIAPEFQFRHQSSFFLVLALVSGVLAKSWFVTGLAVIASVVCFLNYPALTYVYVGLVASVFLVVHYLARAQVIALLATFGISALAIFYNRAWIQDLGASYFASVEKGDNTRTREILYQIGADLVRDNPWFGSMFVNNISVAPPLGLTGEFSLVPLHDDYLQFAVGGGLIFAVLFTVSLVWFLCSSIILTAGLSPSDPRRQAVTLYTCGGGAMMAIAVFNPILIVSHNSIVFALLFVLSRNAVAQVVSPPRYAPRL